MTASIPDVLLTPLGETFTFTLEVSDPEGDPISLEALELPPRIRFDPLVEETGPVSLQVEWTPTAIGPQSLTLLASDGLRSTRRSFEVITQGQNRNLAWGDVTGDGQVDLIATLPLATGAPEAALVLWAGGPRVRQTPTARLLLPDADPAEDLLLGHFIELVDVTGDGIRDLVVSDALSDVGGVRDSGMVLIWKGGDDLRGDQTPWARLHVPVEGLRLGAVEFADLNGDGVLDLLAGSSLAPNAGSLGAGAWYVWAGGNALAGSPSPLARLSRSTPLPGDRLGDLRVLADVTGDGTTDVVLGSARLQVEGQPQAGGLFVWEGGLKLSGDPAPGASLFSASPQPNGWLGWADWQDPVLVARDLTADGIADLLVAAASEDVDGAVDEGSYYLWAGGASLRGAAAPSGRLRVPGAVHLGRGGAQVRDLNGDSLPEVLLFSPDQAAVQVWTVSQLDGAPAAILTDPASSGFAPRSDNSRWIDLTADGRLDLLLWGSSFGTLEQQTGGATLFTLPDEIEGFVLPTSRLLGQPGDRLGFAVNCDALEAVTRSSEAVQFPDWNRDGVPDVLLTGACGDVGGVPQAGVLGLWLGGPGLSGQPAMETRFAVSSAGFRAHLGLSFRNGTRLVDVTGDGGLDLIAPTPFAEGSQGAVYLWSNGRTGEPAPDHVLRRIDSGPAALFASGALQFADLTGDRVFDVLVGSDRADVGGLPDVGAIDLWTADPSRTRDRPFASLSRTRLSAFDRFGEVYLTDLDGDRRPDLLSPTPLAGTLSIWDGAAAFAGDVPPTLELLAP